MQIHAPNRGIARWARQEVELARCRGDNGVPLEAPVRRRRRRIECEWLVGRAHALNDVQVELASVGRVCGDRAAADDEVPRGGFGAEDRSTVCGQSAR